MRVDSYFELATTLIGWHIAGAIAEQVTATGLILAPFAIVLLRNWSEPIRSQEAKTAATVSLRRMEQDVGLFAIIVIFFFLPAVPISADKIEFRDPELDRTIAATDPETPYVSNLDNISEFRAPIVWWLVHEVSSFVTDGIVNSIDRMAHPSLLRTELLRASRIRITDEELIGEIRKFRNDCYEPALAKYQRQGDLIPMSGRSELDQSVDWIGSRIFVETPGYYKRCDDVAQCGSSYRATTFSAQWTGTAGAHSSKPGYPYCDEWWTEQRIGLRAKLISSMEEHVPSLHSSIEAVRKVQEKKRKDGIHLNIEDYEDRYLRRAINLSPWVMIDRADRSSQARLISFKSLTSVDGWQQIIASLGSLTVSGVIHIVMEFVVIGLPMLQAFLLMLTYISIPVVVPYAVLNPSLLLRIIFVIFSLRFLSVLWAIAEFLDERLLAQLYPDSGLFEFGGGGSSADLVLNLITLTGYLTLPIAWFYIMGALGSSFASSAAAGFNQVANTLHSSSTKSATTATDSLGKRLGQ